MKNFLASLILLIAFNASAELIDISKYEHYELTKILTKIDIEVEVDASVVNSTDDKVLFHISATKSLWSMNWETHESCYLAKENDKYICKIEAADMTHVSKTTALRDYYQVSVRTPGVIYYCNDVKFDKESLKIDKEKNLFSSKYTLQMYMNDCSFN